MDEFRKKQDPMIGKIIEDHYLIKKKLGEGSFGRIYEAEENGNKYAMKFESKIKGQSLLEQEAYIMNYLKGSGIPWIKTFFPTKDYNILVMQLLGKSLEDILSSVPTKTFSVRTTCNLAVQMLNILEYVHDKHIIHRDIKPDNFVMGIDDQKEYVYLLDFGLAKKYRSSKTLKHYPMTNKKKLTGTARYASINALKGFEQSRRDDLESLGYVLLYFLRGTLPWQGLQIKNKEDRYTKIMEKKRDTLPSDLCKNFPKQFETYVRYTQKLEYEEDPKYDYLRGLFTDVVKSMGFQIDLTLDWISKKDNLNSKLIQEDPNKANIIVNNFYNNINNIVISSKDHKDIQNNNNLQINKSIGDKSGNSNANNNQQVPSNNILDHNDINNNILTISKKISGINENSKYNDYNGDILHSNKCVNNSVYDPNLVSPSDIMDRKRESNLKVVPFNNSNCPENDNNNEGGNKNNDNANNEIKVENRKSSSCCCIIM